MFEETFSKPETYNDQNIEESPISRGAGAIFHIVPTDQFMFYLRDDIDTIPFPNTVSIIGGNIEDGETPEEAATREFGEELDDLDTHTPFHPTNLVVLKRWVDDRNIEQNIYGCELDKVPNLRLKEEGQRVVFLNREELANTQFAFDFNEIICEYATTV